MKAVEKKDNFKTFYALSLAWQLGFLIAVPIGGFLFLGVLADRFFRTEPFLLLLGLLAGIVITIYEMYHLFIPLIKDSEKND
ncbi:MAG: AtpZ/AtpI family protein [bacterium]|nr:AtpZ/AtpI family protein [bacterium]